MTQKRIVILGGGFGGLAVAAGLGDAEAQVTVIDQRNHNLFQPLLYQVATAALSPADIAEPIRKTLGRFRNIRVMLAAVAGVDTAAQVVTTESGDAVPYDTLIVATGSVYNYFGNDHWRTHAPGLKSLSEARVIRQRLLLALERAELAKDAEARRGLLTAVVIGGGPTGVEMAGAIAELGRDVLARDFRDLGPEGFHVVLVEAGDRVLSAFPERLSDYTLKALTARGVHVWTGRSVKDVRPDGVLIDEEFVPAGVVVWGAGVRASPAADWLGVPAGKGGKIAVDGRLRVIGLENVHALGDVAHLEDASGAPLPALAQVAKQQGDWLGKHLRREMTGGPALPDFTFHNRGNTAVIGRNDAVFDFGRWQMRGWFAWVLWALVHVWLLVNFEKRILVSIQWVWRYLTRQSGARIIDERAPERADASRPDMP
ncbi:NAD(P)/FAD-dependent oxidoreductase [Falsirhodobacter halotolerans]|uniref:NAD(P)/FAD-dependent oxidoreductase n=1 Tax=Falsirhodobacter halotolerans TaxID=1146892 RepID=UPI001FD34DD0|nr:NAD(P)/FAD-dependent oxidoreductase [Falsirhodobacter halotolerans]MCJ8140775.1 NAD(P)/FAD-dependent oxidoreductase [Falsirhodobacter halotolerans]